MKHEDPFYENWEDFALVYYSSHLIDVIRLCLEDLPSDRITPTALLAYINDPVPDAEDNEDDTLKDRNLALNCKADRTGVNVGNEWPAFINHQGTYRLGMTMQDIRNTLEQAIAADDEAPAE